MKNIFKKSFITLLALIMVLASMNAFAFAETKSGDDEDYTPTGEFVVTDYTVKSAGKDTTLNSITKGQKVDIVLQIKYNKKGGSAVKLSELDVSRVTDSFSGGTPSWNTGEDTVTSFDLKISGLKYKGTGQNLKIMLNSGGTIYQDRKSVV